MRRVLRAGEPTLALICVALFGLVVSPVSWSHHWVWVLPAVLVTGIVAWQRHNAALGVISAAGVALMGFTPINLLPKHHETTAAWWRQLAGMSYVWWALAAHRRGRVNRHRASEFAGCGNARADAGVGRRLIGDVAN